MTATKITQIHVHYVILLKISIYHPYHLHLRSSSCKLNRFFFLPWYRISLHKFPFLQMVHADKTTGELHCVQFGHWVTRHCPRLLVGLREWTKSLLLPQKQETEEQSSELGATDMYLIVGNFCRRKLSQICQLRDYSLSEILDGASNSASTAVFSGLQIFLLTNSWIFSLKHFPLHSTSQSHSIKHIKIAFNLCRSPKCFLIFSRDREWGWSYFTTTTSHFLYGQVALPAASGWDGEVGG